MHSRRIERGQAMALLLVVVVMAALAVVAVGQFGLRLVDRGRAQIAADAAALAATTGGRSAAARLAAGNGAVLTSYIEEGGAVTVAVQVDGQQATARATNGP
jgi:hypothetical protein